MEDNFIVNRQTKWYQTTTGVIVAGLVGTVVLVGVIYAVYVGYYIREIKQGRGEFLLDKVYGGFSQSSDKKQAESNVDRKKLELAGAPFLGTDGAGVTIVEFVDYKCSNSRAASEIMKKVLQKFGDKVKIIVRNFPAESARPGANQLAIFGFCSQDQGLFWVAHNLLFEMQGELQPNLNDENLKQLSDEIGADWAKMKNCMNSSRAKTAVNRDYADGYGFGVDGTPTVFVNGTKIEGVVPFDAWEEYLSTIK